MDCPIILDEQIKIIVQTFLNMYLRNNSINKNNQPILLQRNALQQLTRGISHQRYHRSMDSLSCDP